MENTYIDSAIANMKKTSRSQNFGNQEKNWLTKLIILKQNKVSIQEDCLITCGITVCKSGGVNDDNKLKT